jgi:hypothetical protein
LTIRAKLRSHTETHFDTGMVQFIPTDGYHSHHISIGEKTQLRVSWVTDLIIRIIHMFVLELGYQNT